MALQLTLLCLVLPALVRTLLQAHTVETTSLQTILASAPPSVPTSTQEEPLEPASALQATLEELSVLLHIFFTQTLVRQKGLDPQPTHFCLVHRALVQNLQLKNTVEAMASLTILFALLSVQTFTQEAILEHV